MKRWLMFALALGGLTVFAACGDKEDEPSTEPLMPASEAQLAAMIQAPYLPNLKSGTMISWASTYDEVLDALAPGYEVEVGFTNDAGDEHGIAVRESETQGWTIYFPYIDQGGASQIVAGSKAKNNLPARYVKEIKRWQTTYKTYAYSNTIVITSDAGSAVMYFPRTYWNLVEYQLLGVPYVP